MCDRRISGHQNDVISGRDGELTSAIMQNIGDTMKQYGINLLTVETKQLDLPSDNKAAVYELTLPNSRINLYSFSCVITIEEKRQMTIRKLTMLIAKQGKETAINNANKYRNEKLPEAAANVDKILQEAAVVKEQRINEANGQVARFNAMYEEYIKNPLITKQRMFYETMENVLPSLKVIINGSFSLISD